VLYLRKLNWLERDKEVIDALNAIIAKRARWGFWKCYERMRLDGLPYNHKKVHRVYCDMKLNMPRRTKKRLVTRPAQPLVSPSEVNNV
jgi:putative transposase